MNKSQPPKQPTAQATEPLAKKRYFGTDGMRGEVNTSPMTPQMVMRLAMAVGHYVKQAGTINTKRVIIGKDTRLSGYMLEPALTSGFIALGYDVLLLGPVPTPGVSMLTRSLRADIGVMLSASHNPFHDNGIKIFDNRGRKLSDSIEIEIENHMDEEIPLASSEQIGRATRLEDVPGRYIEFLKAQFPRNMRLNGLKIVVDAAHGAAYKVAPAIFWEFGAEVIATGVQPNGININKQCGATHPDHVINLVKQHKADIGIALDGDADRIQMVDSNGKLYEGDHLLAILAGFWQKKQRLSGGAVVSTIMANMGLENYLKTLDLGLWRTAVGDRYVAEKMTLEGCNLGGESSGHIIMNDYTNTGDGMMSALQVLHCLSEENKSLSDYADLYEKMPNHTHNIRFDASQNIAQILEQPNIKQAIAQQEQILSKAGARLVVRKSGTEPLIRLMAEGMQESLLKEAVDTLCQVIEKNQ